MRRRTTSKNIFIQERAQSHKDNIEKFKTALAKAVTKRQSRSIQKHLKAERSKLSNVRTLRRKFKNSFKKGTALPFSPFVTPTHYKSRKALNARVRLGFRRKVRAYNLDHENKTINKLKYDRPLTKYHHKKVKKHTAKFRRATRANMANAYDGWKSRRLPLWKTRVVRR